MYFLFFNMKEMVYENIYRVYGYQLYPENHAHRFKTILSIFEIVSDSNYCTNETNLRLFSIIFHLLFSLKDFIYKIMYRVHGCQTCPETQAYNDTLHIFDGHRL